MLTLVNLTKSYTGIWDTELQQGVDIFEIPIDFETWIKVSKGTKNCKYCHKELIDFEKVINIQHHYQNKTKGRISYHCYECAQERM